MSIENDLQKWLERPENDFITNLEFGIKVWNSMEFILLTKYEIIFEYFCNNLYKLITKYEDNTFTEKWSKINDFLKLDYPPNSVSFDMKCKLINVLINEVDKLPKFPKETILQSFLILLNHDSMINCYKNIVIYGQILVKTLEHFILYLKASEMDNYNVKLSATSVINNLNTYIKQTTDMDEFCRIFSNKIQTPLTELIIILNIKKINYDEEYFKLLQIMYYNEKSIEIYRKQIRDNDTKECLLSSKIYPNFVFIKLTEGFLINFKYDLDIITQYIKYLFDNIFIWESGLFANTNELLKSIDFLFYSLRNHNLKLLPEINGIKTTIYIGDKIKTCIDLYFQTNTYETIRILCSTIKFNPIIVEQYIFSMFTKYMLAKKDDKLLHMYTELSFLFLNMFQKLSRTEKYVSSLITSVREELNNVKLVKRQKRKLNSENNIQNSLDETNLNVGEFKNGDYIDLLHTDEYSYQVYDEVDPDSWQDIAFAWPAQTTGAHFSQIVSNMVSKPSLVIWKSIIYPLNDAINKLPIDKIDENSLFIVDFLSALFCEYLSGNRLAEQTDKFWDELNANRELTNKLLKEFGMTLLKIEHNSRLMNAFLQICYYVGNLDLLCWYYCPEIVLKNNEIDFNTKAKNIHSYLTKDEWILIEQRIVNFGKTICKNNMNKLYLQRIRTNLLFNNDKHSITSTLLLSSLSDYAQIIEILKDNTSSILFINLLSRQEKILVANLIITAYDIDNLSLNKLKCIFDNIKDNIEMVNILLISIYKKISKVISNKKSALCSVNYDSIYAYEEEHLNDLISVIKKKINKTIKIDKTMEDALVNYLNLLKLLPIGFIDANMKNLVFILNMLLYCDIRATESDTVLTTWKTIFDYLFEIAALPNIFQYFDIHLLLSLFENINLYKNLFEKIFIGSLKLLNENLINNLQELLHLLNDNNVKENIFDMSTILFSCFQHVKRFDSHRKEIKTIQINLQKKLFEIIKKVIMTNENIKMENDLFISKTLNCLNILMKILPHDKINNIDDILSIYLNYCKKNILETDAQQLILTIFVNKNLLKLSSNEIEEISDIYLNKFKEQIKNHITDNNSVMVISTDLLKTILDNKSDEDFLTFMDHLYEESKEENPTNAVLFITKFMSYLGKCDFNITKQYIFGDYIKVIFFYFQSKLSNNNLFESNINITCDVLATLTIICSNQMIPITAEHIDDILLFLIEINIKKMKIDVNKTDDFFKLHEKMSDLCLSLIQKRLIFILERLVQFTCVLKDLQQSICWYRSERDKDDTLENNEINILAELMYNLENIYNKLFRNNLQMKKLSPYLLLFTIYLMVENPRPTTLHQKVKTHVQNICYVFIKNCDDKLKPFIMRESSEASKKLYEKLNDEYNKYHKFKGKI